MGEWLRDIFILLAAAGSLFCLIFSVQILFSNVKCEFLTPISLIAFVYLIHSLSELLELPKIVYAVTALITPIIILALILEIAFVRPKVCDCWIKADDSVPLFPEKTRDKMVKDVDGKVC